MSQNSLKTTLAQKILLVFFGFFLTVILLEVGLRVGGFVFLSFQEGSNRVSLDQNDSFRILCLGESTTALGGDNSYPRQLENILNSTRKDIHFSVINKGIPSITTTQIVANLEKYLDEYKPHLVVVMMGINDGSALQNNPNGISRVKNPFLEKFQIFKLTKLLWLHVTYQDKKETKNPFLEKALQSLDAQVNANPSSVGLTKLANFYGAMNNFEKQKEILLKAIEYDPNNYQALGYLGTCYKHFGDYKNASHALEEMIKAIPDKGDHLMWAYAELGDSYRLEQNYSEARRGYLKSIEVFPNHPGAFGCLGDVYMEQERYTQAQALFEKQLQIYPLGVLWYGKLAHCYQRQGRSAMAERLLKQGLRLNPSAAVLYLELGECLMQNKKYDEAERVFKQALQLEPEALQGVNVDIDRYLLASYEAQGKNDLAKKLRRSLLSKEGMYTPLTRENYQKLKEILSRRKILLVVMQYPMRDIGPIKEMLEPAGGILFVENKKNFKEAIAKANYDDYFTDRFAGDFGHCTPKGNFLLAQNAANVIVKNCSSFFKKNR